MLERRLLDILTRLPRTISEDFEVDEIMRRLGDEIAEILDVAGAGVMLEDEQGNLRFVGASDPVLHELERLQIELDEGPCLLAYRTGREVIAVDLRDDDRFPRFGGKAGDVGMGSVYSFALRYDEEVIGALNLYDTEPRSLTDETRDAARTLADVATAYLLNARDVSRYRTRSSQLARALDSRVIIEQAKGWIRARTGVDERTAFEALRSTARSRQVSIHALARDVLADGEDVEAMVAALD